MLSKRASSWKWYDWLIAFFVIIVICILIQKIVPTSGLAQALHQGFHALAIGLEWIAGGLNALAGLLNQL